MTWAKAININDLREAARKRLPRMVFDYIDGGADDEVTLSKNESRLRDIELVWNALTDVAEIDTTTKIMGEHSRLPFMISPTAASRLFHPRDGECAVARAAYEAGMIYSCSTIASTTVEDIAAASPGPKWIQVYVWKDRSLVRDFLARSKAAGFTGCILTVDVPVAGNRERDPRNGFSIPVKLNGQTLAQVLAKPGYLADVLSTPRAGPANFKDLKIPEDQGIIEFINSQFDQSVTWEDAAWMAQEWGGPFAIKGISNPSDARRCVEAGANAVWVSNHGGRQLDGAPATIDTLPGIVDAVAGDAEIIFDGGVRRGSDIVKALALGATGVAIGRAYLFGLAAGGEPGVAKAISILETELRRTMALMGATSISGVTSDFLHRRNLP